MSNRISLEAEMSIPERLKGATFTPHVDKDGNISWTNDDGLTNPATVNIRGPKGEDSTVPGPAGFSPYVTLAQTSNGWAVTVTDSKGNHMFEIENGAKGDKGDSYVLTEEDKQEIADMVGIDMSEVESLIDAKIAAIPRLETATW